MATFNNFADLSYAEGFLPSSCAKVKRQAITAEEQDAHRVMEVLPKRFRRYGLTVHPTKTRLVDFTRPHSMAPESHLPAMFDFLRFTHYCGRAYRGGWVIKRKTASIRLR